MKKVMAILLVVLLTVFFAACQPQGEEINPGLQTATPTQEPTVTNTGDITQPTEIPVNTQESTQEKTPNETPSETTEATTGSTQKATQEATPEVTTQTPTKAPTATVKPTTAKPTTAKPTATATAKPEVTYSPVSGISIANDAVAAEISLDNKVPQNLKAAYNTVKTAFSKANVSGSGEKTVNFSAELTVQELKDVIYYVEVYNPNLFYVNWNNVSYTTSGATGKVKAVTLNCTSAVSQYDAVMNKANQIVTEANKKPNLFERELYIHDWLVKNIQYDKTTENAANVYGALIEGKALCEGYSRAFQYLMNKIGIETVLITGTAGEAHMWNMVKLHGQYYFVDVTHDDPTPDQVIENGKEYLIGHSCFNITTSTIGKTHTIDAKGSRTENGFLRNADLQTCTSTSHNYYYVNGLAVSNMDQFQYVLYENKSVQNVEVYFTGTMPNIEDIKSAVVDFIKATYPGKGYTYTWTSEGSSSVKRNCIRISWAIK